MKILVAPDKFKGSLTAAEAAGAISSGLRKVWPAAVVRELPIADGGEGTAATVRRALSGVEIPVEVRDPLGRRIHGSYTWISHPNEGAVALIEMSAASGLVLLRPAERNPLVASTFGTGEMIGDAVARGANRIIIGLGGSASNDGGIGMAAALGFSFLTSDGDVLEPIPANLLALIRIARPAQLDLPPIVAACDVANPLLGPSGASRIYGPQKGADSAMIETLEAGLENLAEVVAEDLECDFRDTPGAGAAGGLGFGLLSFCAATMQSGFDLVADILGLEEAIRESDLVVTGEGRIDAQTLNGKGPAGVAVLARRHGKPVLALAGSIEQDVGVERIFDAVGAMVNGRVTLSDAVKRPWFHLEQCAQRAGELMMKENP